MAAVLEMHRGFGIGDFVRRDVLAGCDFWVPNPGFIVEFDESQHFTSPRKLTLSMYANEQPLGFSAERWIALCEHHDARDNAPPYRDEQRAWYDALRDLVPSLKGLRPTVRLYASDVAWCSLDPDSRDDRETLLGPDASGVSSVQSNDGGNPLALCRKGINPARGDGVSQGEPEGLERRSTQRCGEPTADRADCRPHSQARPSTSCSFPKGTYVRQTPDGSGR